MQMAYFHKSVRYGGVKQNKAQIDVPGTAAGISWLPPHIFICLNCDLFVPVSAQNRRRLQWPRFDSDPLPPSCQSELRVSAKLRPQPPHVTPADALAVVYFHFLFFVLYQLLYYVQ